MTTFIYSIMRSVMGKTPEENLKQDRDDILRRLRSLEAISYEIDNGILFQLEGFKSKWIIAGKGRFREEIPDVARQAAAVLHGLEKDAYQVSYVDEDGVMRPY